MKAETAKPAPKLVLGLVGTKRGRPVGQGKKQQAAEESHKGAKAKSKAISKAPEPAKTRSQSWKKQKK